ncbi:hypothetical protein GCM10010218_12960 [Streptomyces mashuensis]|uniref:Uncharacterized protein n=1 Tax=Streptomyces mashuensis TaxID=33904 RepID=A0A919AZL2_9ACTN|nr:DUF6415 family natural product biosynthesis protein [Streptomyces mashuensis]GHF33274.1 hypothetical protein GCM10010218_12960 [Streptomyces mashuensis]
MTATAPGATVTDKEAIQRLINAAHRMYGGPLPPYQEVQAAQGDLLAVIAKLLAVVEARASHRQDGMAARTCETARRDMAAGLGPGLKSAVAAVNRLAVDTADLLHYLPRAPRK